MIKFVILATLVPLIHSCGQTKREDLSFKKTVTYNSYSSNPIALKKQSKSCFGKKFESTLFDLKLFDGISVNSTSYDYLNLLDNLFVRDLGRQVIHTSFYNQSLDYQITKKLDGEITYSGGELKSALDITVCPEEDYHEESVENAALSANYFINKTAQEIKKASPEINLPPIKLNIGPLIKITTIQERYTDILMDSSYLVDNASYSPSTQTISFYPQSEEAKKAGIRTTFWQVPMVSSHEYGHHVFNQIFPFDLSNKEVHVCVDNRSLEDKTLTSEGFFKVKDVINSFNEGFADLVANYTLTPKEVSLRGIECMEDNRELKSSVFKNGSKKMFDYSTVFSIFASWYSPSRTSCAQPDFKDTHTVGAVFAYFAESYLSVYTTSNSEKLRVLMEWVKELKTDYNKNKTKTAEKYFKLSMQNFVKLAPKVLGQTLTPAACQKADSLYYGLTLDLPECR